MEIALLGGSFNPPHVGHLVAAVYLKTVVGSDEVWLLPSFNHPFGKPLTPFEDRLAMCEALGADLGPWLKVSRAEAEVGGEGRTIDLLRHLLPKYAQHTFRFVIGSDILGDLPKWKAWDEIERLVKVTVLNRAGHPDPRAMGPPMAQVSSSEIRKRFEAGLEPTELVPRAVLACARARGLYGLKPRA